MILNPLDGRYKNAVSELALLIGEDALILLRIKTECLYLLALADEGVVKLSRAQRNKILSFADGLPGAAFNGRGRKRGNVRNELGYGKGRPACGIFTA